MVILLAGIFSALAQPIYQRLEKLFKGRKGITSLTTLLFILLIFFLPLVGLLGIVTGQAIKISNSVKPFIAERINKPHAFDEWFQSLPFYDTITAYDDVILQKAGELVGKMSNFLLESVSAVTLSTVISDIESDV